MGVVVFRIVIVSALLFYKMRRKQYGMREDALELSLGRGTGYTLRKEEGDNDAPSGRLEPAFG